MKRTASAAWSGNLKAGHGRFNVGSGAIKNQKYDFRTRFEDEPGTNPEELIAAAASHGMKSVVAISTVPGGFNLASPGAEHYTPAWWPSSPASSPSSAATRT